MDRLKLVLFICVILSFASCKKHLADVNSDFEGEWHAQPVNFVEGVDVEMYFIIDGNQGVYGEWCELVPLGSNCSRYFKGEAKINRKESKISIGKAFEGGRVVFRIDVPPHINSNGNWECTLTETVYIKN